MIFCLKIKASKSNTKKKTKQTFFFFFFFWWVGGGGGGGENGTRVKEFFYSFTNIPNLKQKQILFCVGSLGG